MNNYPTRVVFCSNETDRNITTGFFIGRDVTKFPPSLFLLQISIVNSFTAIFEFLLKPLGLPQFVPQILGAIATGPTLLTRSTKIDSEMFHAKSLVLINTYETLAFIFVIFLLSSKLDVSVVKRAGNLAIFVGVSSFFIPFFLTYLVAGCVVNIFPGAFHFESLVIVLSIESTTWFNVTFEALSHLKLVNSEIGRLALSTSMINTFLSIVFTMVIKSVKSVAVTGRLKPVLMEEACKIILCLMVIVVFKPILKGIQRRAPEAKPLNKSHLCLLCLLVLSCGFIGEVTGQSFIYGIVVLGLVTPHRLPFGPALTDKMGTFVSAVFMPCYMIALGRAVNVVSMRRRNALLMGLIIITTRIGKLVGVLIPTLCYKMPFSHAISLGLILNIQGHYDVMVYKQVANFKINKAFTEEVMSSLVLGAMIHSAFFTLMVQKFYYPSKKFVAYKRKTIQHHKPPSELTVLACFHDQDNVPSIISFLEATNPNRDSPLAIYALNLEELTDRTLPLFIRHRQDRFFDVKRDRRFRAVKAFRQFAAQNQGVVRVQCFTSLVPLVTMHEDVCALALEKRASLVVHGLSSLHSAPIRGVHKNVLSNAPCSVAVLLDRGLPSLNHFIVKGGSFNVCTIFLGGPDDQEALAIVTRMAEHPCIRIQVISFFEVEKLSRSCDLEEKLDLNAINKFKVKMLGRNNVEVKHVNVVEAYDMMEKIRDLDDEFDLIIVGVNHRMDGKVCGGLKEWSNIRELGVVGDMLASGELGAKASVLAVQQQSLVVEGMVDPPSLSD